MSVSQKSLTSASLFYVMRAPVAYIGFVGEVRAYSCYKVEQVLDTILQDTMLSSVLLDCRKATLMDSTALGMMARFAIEFQKRQLFRPLLLSDSADINPLLTSMGLHKIFNLVQSESEVLAYDKGMQDLLSLTDDALIEGAFKQVDLLESCVSAQVIDAHEVLMGLSADNHETFSGMVSLLKEEMHAFELTPVT